QLLGVKFRLLYLAREGAAREGLERLAALGDHRLGVRIDRREALAEQLAAGGRPLDPVLVRDPLRRLPGFVPVVAGIVAGLGFQCLYRVEEFGTGVEELLLGFGRDLESQA